MKLLGLLVVFTGIILIDVPGLIKGKKWRELAIHVVFLVFGVGMAAAVIMNITLPNPANVIKFIFTPLSNAMFSLFE